MVSGMVRMRVSSPRGTAAVGGAIARRFRAALGAVALCLLPSQPTFAQDAASNAVTVAHDLAADARLAARRRVPLVVLYSRDDCSWCEKVRREHLGPLSRDPAAPAIVREVHMDHAAPLLDFAGRHTTGADFSRQMHARFAPTVMFHGPDGATLAEPIVGFRLADFYAAYLERAILDSQSLLRREK